MGKVVSAVVAAVLFVAGHAGAASTSPGKNAVFASGSGICPTGGTSVVLSATIAKGKANHVLTVQATTLANASGAFLLMNPPNVNGVFMETANVFGDCANESTCTLNGMWWLDLDAAEASSPGQFYGQSLTVNLKVTEENHANSPCFWTMIVRLEKK